LSDPARRREYDASRRFGTASSSFPSSTEDFDEEIPRPQQSAGTGAAGGGFPWSTFGNMFGFGGGNQQNTQNTPPHSNAQFESVFEEMMREEGMADGENQNRPTGKFWSVIGGVSGGAMGFIVANVPGAMAGALAGNRLGSVRDTKGKAVYSVFQVRQNVTVNCCRHSLLIDHTGVTTGGQSKAAERACTKGVCSCCFWLKLTGRMVREMALC